VIHTLMMGLSVARAMAATVCSPYWREGPLSITTTPASVTTKAVLTMRPPLAKEKSSCAPSSTQVSGAIWRGARR